MGETVSTSSAAAVTGESHVGQATAGPCGRGYCPAALRIHQQAAEEHARRFGAGELDAEIGRWVRGRWDSNDGRAVELLGDWWRSRADADTQEEDTPMAEHRAPCERVLLNIGEIVHSRDMVLQARLMEANTGWRYVEIRLLTSDRDGELRPVPGQKLTFRLSVARDFQRLMRRVSQEARAAWREAKERRAARRQAAVKSQGVER